MKRILFSIALLLSGFTTVQAAQVPSIADTVVRMEIADDVSMDDAIESMKLRANALNFKLVAHMPMSMEAASMGYENPPRVEIFQFCDASIAIKMVAHDMNFGAYMPCRIALVEGRDDKNYLVMANLDFFMGGANLPPDLMNVAIKVRDTLQEIMEAGAEGDL